MTDNREIDYRFLNLDTKKFHPDLESLEKSLMGKSYTLRADFDIENNQCLYGGSNKSFTKFEMGFACKKLTGVV